MALNYQQMIGRLQEYWAGQGCVLMQPYHTEVGAGTFNPADPAERPRGALSETPGT